MADECQLADAADTAERDALKALLKANLSLSIGVDYARAYSEARVMKVAILFDGKEVASELLYVSELQA